MPAKVKKRGESSYLLTVTHKRIDYTKTIHASSEQEAENQWVLFKADVLRNKISDQGKGRTTLSQFYEYWKENYANEHLETTTRTMLEGVFTRIKLALGNKQLEKIEQSHILAFYKMLRGPEVSASKTPLSQAYIRKHASLLRTLLTAAHDWNFIDANPHDKVKLPKPGRSQKKLPTEDDLRQLLALMDQKESIKHRLWVSLVFALGLRREELFGLKWGAIDFERKTIQISIAVVYITGKGIEIKDTKTDNSYRLLSLPDSVANLLQDWKDEVIAATKRRNKRSKVVKLDEPTSADKWVFPKLNGTVPFPHAFNIYLRRFCESNDLPHMTPHQFRHLSGSYLLNAGVDIATVSAKLGHADKSFTMKTYIHQLQSAEQKSAETMNGIMDSLKSKNSKKSKDA